MPHEPVGPFWGNHLTVFRHSKSVGEPNPAIKVYLSPVTSIGELRSISSHRSNSKLDRSGADYRKGERVNAPRGELKPSFHPATPITLNHQSCRAEINVARWYPEGQSHAQLHALRTACTHLFAPRTYRKSPRRCLTLRSTRTPTRSALTMKQQKQNRPLPHPRRQVGAGQLRR